MAEPQPTKKSSPLLVVVAWLVVIIPAGWGLSYTVQNAVKIFTRSGSAAAGGPAGSAASAGASAVPAAASNR